MGFSNIRCLKKDMAWLFYLKICKKSNNEYLQLHNYCENKHRVRDFCLNLRESKKSTLMTAKHFYKFYSFSNIYFYCLHALFKFIHEIRIIKYLISICNFCIIFRHYAIRSLKFQKFDV